MKKDCPADESALAKDAAYQGVFEIIKYSLWGTGTAEADEAVYGELRRHAVEALAAPALSSLSLTPELRQKWQKAVLRQVAVYMHYCHVQSVLPLTVPYVILKGTSAAMYYPCPEYRAMGDIDVMTRREDFDRACHELIEDGFQVFEQKEREISFRKNRTVVELHRYFASLNSPEQAEYLDDLIIEGISPSHVLPEMTNGLVLLEHISQHLEHGLGLRQIIDWMMFVNKCLPDGRWAEFEPIAKKIGMDKLAVTVTRMCEIYLGLPERNWSGDADETACERLMEYVMACGNFGNKWTDISDSGKMIISYTRGLTATFKLFQGNGLKHWEAAKKHAFLRPFAWLYQLLTYIRKGVGQEGSLRALKMEYTAARQRNALFDALGVKQRSKGLVVYRDGKYVRE